MKISRQTGGTTRRHSPPALLLVTDALVLIGAAVENAACLRVALEPRTATFELASRLDRSHAMPLAGVLGHASHLRPDSPGPLSRGLSIGSRGSGIQS